MDNPGTLSKLEQLHLFLDGELDPQEEEGLFHAVATDPEIRSELRDVMTMRRAFHGDAVRILPGDALKMSLLAAIDSEFGPVVPPPVGRSWSLLDAALKYFILPVLTGVVGFYLGAELPGDEEKRLVSAPPEASSSSFSMGIAAARVLDGPGGAAVISQRPGADAPTRHDARPVARSVESGSRDRIAEFTVMNGNLRVASPDAFRHDPATAATSRQRVAVVERVASLRGEAPSPALVPERPLSLHVDSLDVTGSTPLYPAVDSSRPLGISLHVRNFSALAYPSTTIPTNSAPLFDNASFGVLFALSRHDRVGMEVGQEAFPQIFETTLDGQKVRVEQNPHTWWVAGEYRLIGNRAFLLLDGAPFIEASVGASGLGGIARGGVGIDLAPDERWSFIVSLHGSLLAYRSNQTMYVSRKVGLLYGASVRF